MNMVLIQGSNVFFRDLVNESKKGFHEVFLFPFIFAYLAVYVVLVITQTKI